MPTRTMLYYAYWVNADTVTLQDFFFEPPWICAHFPADDGHHVRDDERAGRASAKAIKEPGGNFTWSASRSIPQLWGRLSNAQKVSKRAGELRGSKVSTVKQAGPGWALLGDAAHFQGVILRPRKESVMHSTLPRRSHTHDHGHAAIAKSIRRGMSRRRVNSMRSANFWQTCRPDEGMSRHDRRASFMIRSLRGPWFDIWSRQHSPLGIAFAHGATNAGDCRRIP